MTIGSRLATTILTELHGEFVVHFSAIFITEIDGFYRDILGKSGPPLSLRPLRRRVGALSPSSFVFSSRRSTR